MVKRRSKLESIDDAELLDELARRFSSWLFFGRKTDDQTGEYLGSCARWQGDRDVCMGGAHYIAHNVACKIDEELAEADEPEGDSVAGYL